MSTSKARLSAALRAGCVVLGLALLATGLIFVVGGAKLALLHGSAYFVIAGAVIAVSAVQFMRAKSSAVLAFGAVFIGTLVWAPIDGGFRFLAARVAADAAGRLHDARAAYMAIVAHA